MNQDAEHLRLLSIFHYILGGITMFFSLFPIIHLIVGIVIIWDGGGNGGPPRFIGFIFAAVALVMITLGMTIGLCAISAGRYLTARTNYTFCFVIACIECLSVPLGTILGVFTIIVLTRPTVKEAFDVLEGPARPPQT